ncbi:MAG: hypothetical protein HYT63_00030 [Candidatus Yanofskybacteria bacterium]|nr:hypothetical protein [Candidatus Yanofskybacteria bacterium]
MSKKTMGWGAVLVAVLIAATQYFNLSANLNYLWALLVLVWGLKAFK